MTGVQPPSPVSTLSAAVRALAEVDAHDPVLHAGVLACVRTMNRGVTQETAQVGAMLVQRKHRCRLRAALLAMASELEREERDADA